ncbi:zinc-dependent alcohol dehydrogenase [Ornithinimicrobium cavernae]|uniref:zinc-dependent alcohol dehydrogenase n=1 Tax=Ornithinimicrobium cavernae TaxID=2666047 RepID=UPI000D69DF6F|nr:zinc-binding dehydrogenase [Ornithinimicrobium cavernae]
MSDEQRYLTVSGPRTLEESVFTTAEPGAGRVVVDVTYTGICGTDVHGYTDGSMLPPAVFGHEWMGTVRSVGEGVTLVSPGDRVVGGVGPACGRCGQCLAGHSKNCDVVFAEANGVDEHAADHGAFATQVDVSERRVVPVPQALSDIDAALVEPAAVTFHAVRRANVEPGCIAVVVGAGPIGLLTAQNARAAGAGRIIISEPSDARRATARELGFDDVVEPDELQSRMDSVTAGVGADIVFECAGVPTLLQSSAELVRRGGTLALLGFPLSESTVSYADWQQRELTVIGSLAYNREDFVGVMRLVEQGSISLAPLHTGTIALSEVKDMLEELDSGRSTHTKVLVAPRGQD